MPPKRKPRSTPDLSAALVTTDHTKTTTTTTSKKTTTVITSASSAAVSSSASSSEKPYFEYLRCTTGGSNKFYYILAKGTAIVIRFGRAKSDGQVQHQSFDSAEDAIAHARKIVAEKLRKGYKVAQVPKGFFQGFAIGDPDAADGNASSNQHNDNGDDEGDDDDAANGADADVDADAEGSGEFQGFGGMTFVLAGVVGDERREMIGLIKAHGGAVAAAPSFKTTHLILGPGAYGLDVHANALTKGMKIVPPEFVEKAIAGEDVPELDRSLAAPRKSQAPKTKAPAARRKRKRDEYEKDDDEDDDDDDDDGPYGEDDDDDEDERPKRGRKPAAKRARTEAPTNDGPGASVLAGYVFCITGALSRVRRDIEADIRKHGGECTGSVSGRVTHLLIGEGTSGTAKHERALVMGVPIVDEDWLLVKISGRA